MNIKFNYIKKNIEDVKIGDYVKSFNLETLTNEPRKVLNTFRPEVLKPSRIDFIDGGYIVNSEKHPILVKRAGEFLYKNFDEIIVGDIVLRDDGGETLVHKKTSLEYKNMEFYDIEVDYNNNFYAGFKHQYCNHNSANLFLPFYHYEVELFSQLGDSRGTVETRARHTDQTIILNSWFLKKALNKEDIYLFHMHKVPKLYKRLGKPEEFDEWYNKYVKSVPARNKKKVNAFELLKLFLFERSITGRLYFAFADNLYKSGAFKIPVYNLNLCLEISLPSKPLDGFLGTPEIAACILGNINAGYAEMDDIPVVANFLVRFLDNLIDYSDYVIEEVEYAAKNRRALGIGVGNLFGALAKNKIFYNTQEGRQYLHEFAESFYYHLLKTSNDLAKEKGRCNLYHDTNYDKDQFTFDNFPVNKENNFKLKQDWDALRKEIKEYGLRNSTLCATPPAANSGIVSNSTSGVEPPRELIGIKTDKNSTYKKIVPYFRNNRKYYTTAWGMDFNNVDYIKFISNLAKFTDQSISLNMYHNVVEDENKQMKIYDMINELIFCFNYGIKSLYYANFRSEDTADGLSEKEGCSSGGCSV